MEMAQSHLIKNVSVYDVAARKALENARAAGIEVIDAPDSLMAELSPAADAMDEAWIAKAKQKGVDGRAALAFYRETARANAEKLDAIVTAGN